MGRRRALIHLNRFISTPKPSLRTLSPSLPLLSRGTSAFSPFLRFLSAIPAISEEHDGNLIPRHHQIPRYSEGEEEEDEGDDCKDAVRYIPVKSYFLSTSIDVKGMQADHAEYVVPATSRSANNYAALRFSDYPPGISEMALKESRDSSKYAIVFQYGSAVLFNIADHEAEHYLDIVKKHASGLCSEPRKDDYAVMEKPTLTTWMQGGADFIALKNLDMDSIRIIGSVLGQSIALDHYIKQVDDMVEEFTYINRDMEDTGNFTMQRKKLFKLVGRANSNLADVIIKLGLFDRSEIAWRNANYAEILEYLREEFELTQRFGSLDFKLKFVEHNIHFLQEALQNRRSDLLEWTIIILLAMENIISLYEILNPS